MYSLVVLLRIVTVAAFVGAFVLERGRRWTVGFALSQAALLYTHNWGLLPRRRARRSRCARRRAATG